LLVLQLLAFIQVSLTSNVGILQRFGPCAKLARATFRQAPKLRNFRPERGQARPPFQKD
jgi:hypothetical protein